MRRTIGIASRAMIAAAMLLAGCGRDPADSPATPAPQPTATAVASPVAQPPSRSRDPHVVATEWARAISLRDWDTAYGYWGDEGRRSGLTRDQFRDLWDRAAAPELELGKAQVEAAAGSTFYTLPVTLIDGARRTAGTVVFRRVNDVPGASAEQLRWHIASTTLDPARLSAGADASARLPDRGQPR